MPPKEKQRYVKLDPIQHILQRADMYVGSTRTRDIEEFVVVDDKYHIEKKTISISPAILRIFIEPLSNAIDNLARSQQGKFKMTKISIHINENTGETSIWNDGDHIPIELHSEEKCYNHTMIFGELRTGSNYDDKEDRINIAGRNGIGIKACLKKGTLVPKFSGEFTPVEDIKIGDYLIGDDGMPRKVLAQLEGTGKLYEVSQAKGLSYTVNENHILTLLMPEHKVIFWNSTKYGWSVLWLDSKQHKICKKTIQAGNHNKLVCEQRKHPTLTDDVKIARKKIEKFIQSIPDDNTLDISIQDYMKLPKFTQSKLAGFFGSCVQWKEQNVPLDPYVLGLFLGGSQKEQDDNKYIPQDYLVNSRDIRLAVLAGLVDSSGYVTKDVIRIVQGLNNTRLVGDIIFLVKSLGFMCNHIKKTQEEYINIFGDGVQDIPTVNPGKNCSTVLKRKVLNSGKIYIKEVETGEYIGFEVDGNNRFVLKDFTVTHNCNVFSKVFTVESVDPVNKKLFKQTWKNNMTDVGQPVVIASKQTRGYTKVTYIPDFTRFGLERYTQDILSVYKRYIVDSAMITKLNVNYNDEPIPVEILVDYAKLYSSVELKEYLYVKTSDCEVVLTPSNNFEAISFANGVCTTSGGTHVDAWCEAIFRPLIKRLNKKGKPQVNVGDVKKFFRLFVVATVKKPEFDSQSKLKLEGPIVEAEINAKHLAIIAKWSVMERLEDIVRMKEMSVLKKTERKKRGYEPVAGLQPANNEGGKKGRDCTLILVEGDSAETYAAAGIPEGAFGKKGRDWFGIMGLRGKVLNCRKATAASIAKNKVVTDIIRALGIQYGIDYTIEENFQKLRYGRVLIICDADVDGNHISALIQNMFHFLFPSLLKREESFLTAMQTPIVRVKDKLFYDEQEYHRYATKLASEGKKINDHDKKYFKGLGTSNEDDVLETFGKKLIRFVDDEKSFENMNKVFGKKADARKDWLLNWDPTKSIIHWNGEEKEELAITFSDFIDGELIKFSMDDCGRSIPNLMDGLKQGHRKVLYTCFKKKSLRYSNKKTMKVAQLAGLVAYETEYHHGETILFKTITGMANAFVGSNNIPFLFRDGQFGSRSAGGKDAANGRYIFTKLDALTRTIFHPDDDELLEYTEDDGKRVEPKYYVPIIPTILVNGCIVGIGTGWSCNVPCYNPLDLVDAIKAWLNKENSTSVLPELKPWYRGHTGNMTYDGKRFISWGTSEKDEKGKIHVTELPVGYWTNDFAEKLEEMKAKKEIANYKNHSTPKTIDFTITENKDGEECDLGLHTYIHTTNMVLFSEQGTLKKYDSIEEIIDMYCQIRYVYYTKRKENNLKKFERQIKLLGNKKRFLEEVRDGELKLFNMVKGKRQSRKTAEIVTELEQRGYDKDDDNEKEEKEEEDKEEEDEIKTVKKSGHGYEYLLRLQISSITAEKIEKLKNDIASNIRDRDSLKGTSEKELWVKDLDSFLEEYHPYVESLGKEKAKKKQDKNKK